MEPAAFEVRSNRIGADQIVGSALGFAITLAILLMVLEAPLDLIRTVATAYGALFLPLTVFVAGRDFTRRRATADLIKSLTTTSEIMNRMQRLYLFRKYDEGAREKNPYSDLDDYDLIYDHVVVLNFFEAVCSEILDRQVDPHLVYEASGNTIVGVEKVLLGRLEVLLEEEQRKDYQSLIKVSDAFQRKATTDGDPIRFQIPPKAGTTDVRSAG